MVQKPSFRVLSAERGRSAAQRSQRVQNRGRANAGAVHAQRSARGMRHISSRPMRHTETPNASGRLRGMNIRRDSTSAKQGPNKRRSGDTAALVGSKEASQAKWNVLTVRRYLTHPPFGSRTSVVDLRQSVCVGE